MDVDIFISIFGEQWTTELVTPIVSDSHFTHSVPLSSTLVMAQTSRFLRALQRIADTARRINPNPRPTLTIQTTPNVLTSLPEHKPLLPLLLSYDIPCKLAKTCAERYDGYASQLKSETESRLSPYLVIQRESHLAQVYSLFLNNYNQTLQRWSQSILNTALKSLKRDSVELRNWEVTYPAPLWLPVRLSRHGYSGATLTTF